MIAVTLRDLMIVRVCLYHVTNVVANVLFYLKNSVHTNIAILNYFLKLDAKDYF